MKKKILSLLLVLVMMLGVLPMGALAAEGEGLTVTDNVIDIADKTVLSGMTTAQAQKITIAGADIVSEQRARTFEEAVDLALDAVKRQIEKRRD